MNGVFATDGAFELLSQDKVLGKRRHLDAEMVAALREFSERYDKLLNALNPAAGLLKLGCDLYDWLNGDGGQLHALLQNAPRPFHFEICTPNAFPSQEEWALLRAPWELLADDSGFLAGDVGLGFSPIRRIGRSQQPLSPDSHRLGLVFMAASPEGAKELDYEAEEVAIMTAVGDTKLDLLVEESGDPKELGERLAEYKTMQVLHLSCHGHNAWPSPANPKVPPKPVLLLENAEGEALPTDASELIRTLGAYQPHLVFLSACLSAAAGGERRGGLFGDKEGAAPMRGGVAHSLSEALINAGLPAVLGWDGSVADGAATAFAAELYNALNTRQCLADAVAHARRALLNAGEEYKRRNWHLSRLWLGPKGGGPIVGGTIRRPMMAATHGQKEFLDKKGEVPVAPHEMFVGRRRELQKALRGLRDEKHAGVLLHGMGRLGKSSLAARIANRRRDLRLAVVSNHYSAGDVLDELSEALKDSPKARDLLEARVNEVRRDPSRLEAVLTDLLCGPCGQIEEEGSPVLLVIDDLEQILTPDPQGGRHHVMPQHAPVLRAVIRAFDAALSAGLSRLIITSRFPFTLEGQEKLLFELHLPPLSDAAQRKLALRQMEALAGSTDNALDERKELLDRGRNLAKGNPGLQDCIGHLIERAQTPSNTKATLDELEAWSKQGDLPSDPELRAFLQNLKIDELLDLAGEVGRTALRKLTLFNLPVPKNVVLKFEGMNDVLPHLCCLGLIDELRDIVDHKQTALSINALASGRLAPLTDTETETLAAIVAHDLFIAWGGKDGGEKRPFSCDLQLTQLGLAAEDSEVVAACAPDAVRALKQGPAAHAAAFGQAAINLLDTQHHAMSLRLLSETASALSTSGNGDEADSLLKRGVDILEKQHQEGAEVDALTAGHLLYGQAQRLMTLGNLDEAQKAFEEAGHFAKKCGNEISATVARGAIADILFRRGDLDEALRIRREEELPVYERLGDVRLRAVTMGKIADILQSRGDLDEALRIRHEEQLPVYERLGDVRSRAVTMGYIADILQSRGDLDEALRIHQERLPVYERLGDVRSRAVTMGQIADILQSRGDLDEALRIRHEEQLPVYERLGDVRERAVTIRKIADINAAQGQLDEAIAGYEEACELIKPLGAIADIAVFRGQIADILFARGDLDEALRIRREEELPVYERLGDVRERAVTMGQIADILQSRGDLDEALRIHMDEILPVVDKLGEIKGRAVTMGRIADILQSRGDLDEALRIRREEELPVYERLGDVRERAVTIGKIADILFRRGDLDEALRIHEEERQPIAEKLGDVDSLIHIWVCASRIRVAKGIGDQETFERVLGDLSKAYGLAKRLTRLDFICAAAEDLGKLLAAVGAVEEARALFAEARDGYTKLGFASGIARMEALLAQLDGDPNPEANAGGE